MPKKKSRKQSSVEAKEVDKRIVDNSSAEGDENVGEEKKYGRRQIQSNWDRYRPESPDSAETEEVRGKTDDFAALLNSPADCNYFRFKSEKNWESEAVNSSFGGHKFFNLDLELLSNGLACIPFYDRVDLDNFNLPESDIEICNKKSEESEIRFKPIKERFLKKLESENELPFLEKETLVSANEIEVENRTERDDSSVNSSTNCERNRRLLTKQVDVKSPVQKNVKNNHHTQGEDLEDWLDSVLDD